MIITSDEYRDRDKYTDSDISNIITCEDFLQTLHDEDIYVSDKSDLDKEFAQYFNKRYIDSIYEAFNKMNEPFTIIADDERFTQEDLYYALDRYSDEELELFNCEVFNSSNYLCTHNDLKFVFLNAAISVCGNKLSGFYFINDKLYDRIKLIINENYQAFISNRDMILDFAINFDDNDFRVLYSFL